MSLDRLPWRYIRERGKKVDSAAFFWPEVHGVKVQPYISGMPANLSFVESQARDAVLAHYGLSKTANMPRFEDAVKLVSPLRRAGAGFLSGALPGAAVGGIVGVLTADKPEDRMRRALIGAAAGTAVGGGLNAARHYGIQQAINDRAREAYKDLVDTHAHVVNLRQEALQAHAPGTSRHNEILENFKKFDQNAVKTIPTTIEAIYKPHSTYLERLFQKTADIPRFEDAVKLVSPLRRAGAGFLSGALPGAAVGGIAGALSADNPEDRMRRALIGAAAGTAVGGGINAARHYGAQRELHSMARDHYNDMTQALHRQIQEFQNHLSTPNLPKWQHDITSSSIDAARAQIARLPSEIETYLSPKRTYLERLFQKQPE